MQSAPFSKASPRIVPEPQKGSSRTLPLETPEMLTSRRAKREESEIPEVTNGLSVDLSLNPSVSGTYTVTPHWDVAPMGKTTKSIADLDNTRSEYSSGPQRERIRLAFLWPDSRMVESSCAESSSYSSSWSPCMQ